MKPRRVQPLVGVINLLEALRKDIMFPEDRDTRIANAITTKIGPGPSPSITIDTCIPGDTPYYETGVRRESIEGEWVIVEQYPDRLAAEAGHNKWVKLLTEQPTMLLEYIDLWSLDQEE